MPLKEVLIATNNLGKLKEIKKILNLKNTKLLTLNDMPCKLIVKEDGKTFQENSLKKAVAAAKKFSIISISDDSGLCVEALNGAPGVKSARFVKPPITSKKLCKKLLLKLKDVKNRKAKFVCSVSVAFPNGQTKTFTANCDGKIAFEMKGENGFGYDPVFIPKGYNKTFAQMTSYKKNILSHRGKAFRQLRKELKKLGF